jgi:hypothetical protein
VILAQAGKSQGLLATIMNETLSGSNSFPDKAYINPIFPIKKPLEDQAPGGFSMEARIISYWLKLYCALQKPASIKTVFL